MLSTILLCINFGKSDLIFTGCFPKAVVCMNALVCVQMRRYTGVMPRLTRSKWPATMAPTDVFSCRAAEVTTSASCATTPPSTTLTGLNRKAICTCRTLIYHHWWATFRHSKFKTHNVAQQFFILFGLILRDIPNSITPQTTLHLLRIPVGLLVLPCTCQCRRSPLTPSLPFFLLSRTEELVKARTCARDRRELQWLALNVHVKHSDLTLSPLGVRCNTTVEHLLF